MRRSFAMADWIGAEVMRLLREPRRMSATRWGQMCSKVRKAWTMLWAKVEEMSWMWSR